MHDPLQRIIKLQTIVAAIIVASIGVALMIFDQQASQSPDMQWLGFFPWSEVGGTLLVAAVLGLGLDYFTNKDKEAADTERLRRVLQESAPAMRDAVIDGFAFGHDDLARVSNPDVLDNVVRNSLALRIGDADFAAEVYNDIRDQAVRAPERWHDARVEIQLSPLGIPRGTAHGGASAHDQPESLFVVTVRWEYTVIPRFHTRRFACLSDKDEYRDLVEEFDGTSAWYFTPKGGIDASQRDAFEVVQFTVDGEERAIRRAERKSGQLYSVSIGTPPDDGSPVRISYTYRTITAERGHLLYVDIEQPTRGIEVELDYGDCDIERVSVLDLIASSRATRVERTPASVPGRSVRVAFDGWAFPRSGVGFVWVSSQQTEDRTVELSDRQHSRP
ncbi:hypothetical protein PP564_12975 [Mycobacteroides abscessus]|uniref:hypothetical protein n=1 Tax=Mycobacteroides abscessus TaxID=36809 RepID=UPI000C266017|nr:hypothetical protein [Mycobacteroides abscessus]MDM2496015.1 hypothetical protein [Mycobacteroides abscessus]MDM2514626.1 hypothetical protein [Mycobacteroides abscessus]MDM2523586.1 hypothetical protein [Mycobacteroides abscessus]MDM2529787.1 hypothetical protein [Mycobacteroides abscessus]MDM2531360.1 hypothetical protein [Mycobacteroides abscessus]